jgi:predicted outer membrane repeat protein
MRSCAVTLMWLICLLSVKAAWAVTTVRLCDSDTQAGAGPNLQQALAGGGTIMFECPRGASVRVTSPHRVPPNTVLDGGDAVTLDGHGLPGPFITSSSGRVFVRRITIRNFTGRPPSPPPAPGFVSLGKLWGSVLAVRGDAELDHVTIESCISPVIVSGDLLVNDSMFRANRGAALDVEGTTIIKHSIFLANESGPMLHGGRIDDSAFIENTSIAVLVSIPSNAVGILHSSFQRNALALQLSEQSAFGAVATVSVRSNRFEDNTRGAIASFDVVEFARERGLPASTIANLERLPAARYELAYDRFLRNKGARGAAIDVDLRRSGGMTVIGGLFIGNVAAGEGGAIAFRGGTLRVSHSLLRGNKSVGPGPAIRAVAGAAARLDLSNSLVIENVGSGAAIDADTAALANVTIARNEGKGLAVRAPSSVANSIVSDNKLGNCSGLTAQAFHAGNLQFGTADCPGVAVGDPFLDTLYVPELGSPALELGDAAICRSDPVRGTDILFQERLGSVCALGAYERAPLRIVEQMRQDRPAHRPVQNNP